MALATTEQLQHLAGTCQPASFGIDQQDVYDESYRKAGKLDEADFAVKLDADRAGLVQAVHTDLIMDRLGKNSSIRAELYKLNLYGTYQLRLQVRT